MKPRRFVITPQTGSGYLVDYIENGELKKTARSTRKNAINFVFGNIYKKSQIVIDDLGEIKNNASK